MPRSILQRPASVEPPISLGSVSLGDNAPAPSAESCIYLPCQINENKYCPTLIDSGAQSYAAVSEDLARSLENCPRIPLSRPRRCIGFSGASSTITHFVKLRLTVAGVHEEELFAYIVPKLKQGIVLGIPWLRHHDPEIKWSGSTVSFGSDYCKSSCLRPNGGYQITVQGKEGPDKCGPDIATIDAAEFLEEVNHPCNQLFTIEINNLSVKSATDIQKALTAKAPPDFSKLPDYLQSYKRLFSPQEANALPPHRPGVDHDIELVEGAVPPCSRMYSMSRDELEVLRKYVTDEINKGYIRTSNSPCASNVLFVRKASGGLRLCVDYRKLNDLTVKDRTTIPLTGEGFERLSRAKIFTKIDVVAAFNKIRIQKGKEWLTAFRTRYGLFEYTVMPMGLTNAPSTFLRYMNSVLGLDALDSYALYHVDDILIYSDSEEGHRVHVKTIFDRLLAAGLYLDLVKCEFSVRSVDFVGYRLMAEKGTQIAPSKIEAVKTWKSPTSVKEVRGFLGFINFFRRYIEGFSRRAKPLTDLTNKKSVFSWSDAAERAFQELKEMTIANPLLALFDPDKPCYVYTDASDFASGAVLKQPFSADDMTMKDLRPVAYFSAKHVDAELRYDAHDKELLAIVKTLREWRAELQGSRYPVKILCDHRNLGYFMTANIPNYRQARWAEFLARFDFKIVYVPGRLNNAADALSRRAQDNTSPERTPEVLLPQEKLSLATAAITILTPPRLSPPDDHDRSLLAGMLELRPAELEPAISPVLTVVNSEQPGDNEQTTDEDIATLLRNAYDEASATDPVKEVPQLLSSGVRRHPKISLSDCTWVNSRLMYQQSRIWVPDDENTRRVIIQSCHNPVLIGHPGNAETYRRVSEQYYWPKMIQDVKRYIRNCHCCQRTKSSRKTYGELMPLPVPQERWQDITMDYITDLPAASDSSLVPGATSILVIVDRLSKEKHFVPCKSMKVEYLARVFIRDVIRTHGLPQSIVTDRGSQFLSSAWSEACRVLGIKRSPTSAFHPQSDGQSERTNQDIERQLRGLCNDAQDDWVDWLPVVEHAMNRSSSAATGMTPFMANKGFEPRMTVSTIRPAPATTPEPLSPTMSAIVAELKNELTLTRQQMADSANQSRTPHPNFQVGDLVWLATTNLKTRKPCRKLSEKWIGPFPVLTAVNNRAYKLELPSWLKVHPVFHCSLLRPANNDPMKGQVNPATSNPGPVSDTEWEVGHIVDLVRRGRGWRYIVSWKNWGSEWNTEEPLENLEGAEDALKEYESRTGKYHPRRKL